MDHVEYKVFPDRLGYIKVETYLEQKKITRSGTRNSPPFALVSTNWDHFPKCWVSSRLHEPIYYSRP